MSPENRRLNIAEEWEKSSQALRAADALLGPGLWNDALTRAYYAAYHAASAVLLTEGLEARTHAGTISLFGERFVKTGRMPADLGRELHELKDLREHADYARGFAATEEAARRDASRAHRFCEAVRAWLVAGGWLRSRD